MRNFEWESEKPLRSEVVAKYSAIVGLCLAAAIWLAMFKYWLAAVCILLAGFILAFVYVRKTPNTKISVDGFTLKYGSSVKVDLEKVKEIKTTKNFGVEEVIMVVGDPGGVVPLKGIPKDTQTELIEVLEERINAS